MLAWDMCHCKGVGCDAKDTCKRYVDKAEGATWVSWASSLKEDDFLCDSYIPIEFIPIKRG